MTRRKDRQKLRRDEVNRSDRIEKLIAAAWIQSGKEIPPGAIPADPEKVHLGNSYDRPAFYTDTPFRCTDCGIKEVWRAEDQLWFYETEGHYRFKNAVRCRECRRKEADQKETARTSAGHAANEDEG